MILPNISVAAVIPLYNGAPFIREALESVIAQTVPADEIIVVDDGSTDDGPAIVAEMAKLHPITMLRKPNGGQSSARNMAIRHTTCTHVALLDQDDAWYEDHLERLRRPFLDGKVRRLALVYGDLDQVDRSGRQMSLGCIERGPSPHPKRSLTDCLRHDMFILPGASLVARQAMIDVGLFDERLSGYEDDDLFLRLFCAGFGSVYLPVSVTRWRVYGGSTSFSHRMAKSRMIYFDKLVEMFPDDLSLDLHWARHVIGPRFMALGRSDFLRNAKIGNTTLMRQNWRDMRKFAQVLRWKARARLWLLGPLIEATCRRPLTGIARTLVRRACR
jgi:glycosyltransferase involved in cell wall biosynthesis